MSRPHQQPPRPTAQRRRPFLIGLALAVMAFLVFLPALHCEFVNYDDPDYVTSNEHVQRGLTWQGVKWAFTTGHASNWHPLTWLSHMLDAQLHSDNAWGHHLTSILFHAINAALVFLVFHQMTGSLWRSAFVAALFALHPLRVESVAWISERKDVLSAFFWMLTMAAYARYARLTGQHSKFKAGSWYALALFLFALGLMSKPMLVTLPFVLLLLDYWPLRRISWRLANPADSSPRHSTTPPLRLLLEKIPFLTLAAASSVITFDVQKEGGAVSPLGTLSLQARVENALVSYVRYLGKMIRPDDLSVLYPHPGSWPLWQVFGAAALLLLISAFVIRLAGRRPFLAVGWFWFMGTLVPVIGLVQVGIQSMADRYTYVPMIGIYFAAVWAAADWTSGWRGQRLVLGTVGGLVLAACAGVTLLQLRHWQTSETLFTRAIAVTKDNYLAYNNLGFFLSRKDRIEEALPFYRSAVRINPAYQDGHNNLGYALARLERYEEAIAHYQIALRLNARHVEAHNNLGNALSNIGRLEEAIRHYRLTLDLKPGHADAHNNLAIALAMRGQFAEAIQHFHESLRLKPDNASAYSNLGNAYAIQGQLDKAVSHYREALRLRPNDAQAHNNLGNALAQLGQLDRSIPHYRKALELNAKNPEAHYNLALALLRLGNRDEAIRHLHEALRLRPNYPDAERQLKDLGAASHLDRP